VLQIVFLIRDPDPDFDHRVTVLEVDLRMSEVCAAVPRMMLTTTAGKQLMSAAARLVLVPSLLLVQHSGIHCLSICVTNALVGPDQI